MFIRWQKKTCYGTFRLGFFFCDYTIIVNIHAIHYDYTDVAAILSVKPEIGCLS